MNKNQSKRLEELEKTIKLSAESALWISGDNATARIGISHKRGKEITFPSVHDCAAWIEKQINSHAGGILDYAVDNICDLYEDADELRGVVKDILPDPIFVHRSTGQVVNGLVQPTVFDADNNFSGILALRRINPGMTADLRLWCLANLIERYFDDYRFGERWKTKQFTDDDNRMMLATMAVYAWQKPEPKDEILAGWAQLFYQVTNLPGLAIDEPVRQNPGNNPMEES